MNNHIKYIRIKGIVMMNRYYFFAWTLLLLLFCLGSLNVLYANGITLEMIEDDRSKLPKGPSPSNLTTYDPTTAETFSLGLTGFEDDAYYEISVALSRSNFKGYAANFPTDICGYSVKFTNYNSVPNA